MIEVPSREPSRSHRVLLLGSVLWPSFLTAGVATAIFFANLDPEALRAATFPSWEISRMAGYTVGFFMFWAVTALSSAVTLLLLKPVGRRFIKVSK